MARSPAAERAWRLRCAQDALTRAAAALTEPATDAVLAFALLHAGLAVVHLAAADTGERARARVEAACRDAQGVPRGDDGAGADGEEG